MESTYREALKNLINYTVLIEEKSRVLIMGILSSVDERFVSLAEARILGRNYVVSVDYAFISLEYIANIVYGVKDVKANKKTAVIDFLKSAKGVKKKVKSVTLSNFINECITVQTIKGEIKEGTLIGVFNDGVCLYEVTTKSRDYSYTSEIEVIPYTNIAHINTKVKEAKKIS